MFDGLAKSVSLIGLFSALVACGGGGGSSTAATPPTETETPVLVELVSTASISGVISPAVNMVVDSDINDPLSEYADNSSFALAQAITNTSIVHGFLTDTPTNFDGDRFEVDDDIFDVYEVSLQAGQQIQMQIVDYDEFANNSSQFDGDLDLALYDDTFQLMGISQSITEFESIAVANSGIYYVVAYSYSGASKYSLQFTSSPSNARNTVYQPLEFMPSEAVVKTITNRVAASAAQNASQAASLDMTLSHHQSDQRAALAYLKLSTARGFKPPNVLSNIISGKATLSLFDSPATDEMLATLTDIKRLNQSAVIEFAYPNYIRRPALVPNDALYTSQWHYPAMNLPQAWDITTGTAVGREVIVAVVDTGIVLSHEDLQGQLVSGYDFISSTSNALDGDGIDNNPDDPGDQLVTGNSSWHGTHVAGTVAANTNNSIGVAGVSWGAKIMPIRVLGRFGGTDYDILQGVRFAAGLSNDSNTLPTQRADIINLSLGGAGYSQAAADVFQEVYDSGVIVVAAAGNEATSSLAYPASYPGVISVSAVDASANLSYYSNFGSAIDIAAPGGDLTQDVNLDGAADGVISTLIDDSSSERVSSYRSLQGTSMAAPHVAGMLALMKAIYPDLTSADVDGLLAAGDLTQEAGSSGRDNLFGHGTADALKAVQAAELLANGGVAPTLPASIVASPQALVINNLTTSFVDVENLGGGSPSIVAITHSSTWVEITPLQVDGVGLGTYTVNVDRTGLVDGLYSDIIAFDFGSTTLRVTVSMSVGSQDSEGELASIYPLLFDPSINNGEGAVIAQATTAKLSDGSIRYQFSDIEPGSYYIYAGTDIDNDDRICQVGEGCGAYPSADQPVSVTLEGDDLDDLDFVANIQIGLSLVVTTFDNEVIEASQLQRFSVD